MKKLLMIALFAIPALTFAQTKKAATTPIVKESAKTVVNPVDAVVGDSVQVKSVDQVAPQYALLLSQEDLKIIEYVLDQSQADHQLVKKVFAFFQQNLRVITPPADSKQKKK